MIRILDNGNWLGSALPVIARLVFASVLFLFFWNSAMTKFDGIFTPSLGAYAQIFPKSFEAVGYDPDAMPFWSRLIALGAGYGEIVLPIMIITGLLTRLAALGMIVFVIVMSYVDITGHNVEAGAFFDGSPYGLIADQRLLWALLFMVLISQGGGRLSIDQWLARKLA